MPPIDPRRIAPPQQLPSGSIPIGTRNPDPYAGQRVGLESQRVGISQSGEKREGELHPFKVREAKANASIAEAKLMKEIEKAQFREPVDEILNVIDTAAKAHKLTRQGGVAADPWGRAVGQFIPGNSARDLAGYNDTIRANTAFKTLQQMRSESPTGGAVGNVSDADMKLLGSTISALDLAQRTPKYQESLQRVLKAYQKVLYKLPGGKEAYHAWRLNWLGYDPSKRKGSAEYKGGASDDVDSILKQYGVK